MAKNSRVFSSGTKANELKFQLEVILFVAGKEFLIPKSGQATLNHAYQQASYEEKTKVGQEANMTESRRVTTCSRLVLKLLVLLHCQGL